MSKPTLLVLAAGMGSRYGGLKQVDPVGPHGETIIDFSIFDALRAGFGKLVFVIRREIESEFRDRVGSRFENRIPVEYAFQDLLSLPAGFSVPPGRQKPWGTGHAVLAAAGVIREPFAVINGDDFYGRHSFRVLAEHLQSGTPDYAMVGYVLRNTLSEFGAVARGVCRTTPEGYLENVVETTSIRKEGAGAVYTDSSGAARQLAGDETVSLNAWGFQPAFFAQLDREFRAFLEGQTNIEKAEFYIPTVVNALVNTAEARVKVLRTPDNWFGITYREDRPRVVESIQRLVKEGAYPDKLWA